MNIIGKSDVTYIEKALIHEHVFCRTRPENRFLVERYLVQQFTEFDKLGIDLIVDTTTYVNPDVFLGMELPGRTKVGCCAGYYTDRYVPKNYRKLSVRELCLRLRRKVAGGVGNYRIHPIMLKAASSGSSPSASEARYIAAVSTVQAETGLPMQVHSCDGAEDQYNIINKYTSDHSKIMYCHVEMGMKTGKRLPYEEILTRCRAILNRGSYLYFNDFGKSNTHYKKEVIRLIKELIFEGYIEQMCIGTDSNWTVRRGQLKVRGVSIDSINSRKYTYMFTHTKYELMKYGVSKADFDMMALLNPAKFVRLGVQKMVSSLSCTPISNQRKSELKSYDSRALAAIKHI